MGYLRIVGGSLRGRRIRVAEVEGVRPTPDRVREALFDILGQRLDGETVLDAFAGTGALGFEALSRGAGSVVFVESDRRVAAALRESALSLGVAERVRIEIGDAVRRAASGGLGGPFDLVLADPPYAGTQGAALLAALVAGRSLAAGARVVLERSRSADPPEAPDGLVLVRTARYGGTAIDFFEHPGVLPGPPA